MPSQIYQAPDLNTSDWRSHALWRLHYSLSSFEKHCICSVTISIRANPCWIGLFLVRADSNMRTSRVVWVILFLVLSLFANGQTPNQLPSGQGCKDATSCNDYSDDGTYQAIWESEGPELAGGDIRFSVLHDPGDELYDYGCCSNERPDR
jgi:hypothetical protein